MSGLDEPARAWAGQVFKTIRVVATSDLSWEDAARNGVAEAVKTIHDLRGATVVQADLVVRDDSALLYRVKLEMAFQLDRSRSPGPAAGSAASVRRYLIIANRTLPSPGLAEVVTEKASIGPAEFHVLVPEGSMSVGLGDPSETAGTRPAEAIEHDRLVALQEAEERLDAFRETFADLGSRLTAEVGVGDPLTATRRVMDRSSFDEIIVSTLPSGMSRWIKLDLPSRLERSYGLPVTHLVPSDDT